MNKGKSMETLKLITTMREQMLDISGELRKLLAAKPWKRGALALFCPHTTCGLTVNEGADPDVASDMLTAFNRLVPRQGGYRHVEGNSDAHIKASLLGPSLFLLVEGGEIRLGTWQSVYLVESDGPRSRNLWAQWLPGA